MKYQPKSRQELAHLVDTPSINLGDIDTSLITDMSQLFKDSVRTDFSGIGGWNTSSVTSMEYMFAGCESFNEDIGSWNVSNVVDMTAMFYGASSFNADISRWRVENLYDASSMFEDATSFKQNLSNWAIIKLKHKNRMFEGCPINLSHQTKNKQFRPTSKRELKEILNDNEIDLNQISVVLITDFSGLFKNSQRTDYGGIEAWNMSNAKNISYMFEGAESFNADISGWDVSRVEDMKGIFKDAINFNQPLNEWDVSSVLNMSEAFEGAVSFNQPLNKWNIKSVQDLSFMFSKATSFNQPLNEWNTSGVQNMYRMFSGATSFNQNLCKWDMNSLYVKNYMFQDGCPISDQHYPASEPASDSAKKEGFFSSWFKKRYA